jgi:NTF2 fold immunity protein
MHEDEIAQCKQLVLDYVNAINQWEIIEYILQRIENGKFVSDERAALAVGLSHADHTKQHEAIFSRYITSRARKLGSNAGLANSVGKDGRFFDVDASNIVEVVSANSNTAHVVTNWGMFSPGGRTMFVLKKQADTWLIDSLKVNDASEWRNVLI